MAATLQLAFLLTHQLATDDSACVSANAASTLHQLEVHRLVKEVEKEARHGKPQDSEKAASALHRWQLRLTSLTSSKFPLASAAGFALALHTSRQSESLFLQHSKQWYNTALTLLTRKAPPSDSLAIAASEFLLFCFEKAAQSQEYAREVANPAGVRKFGEGLLALATSESAGIDTRVHALNSLCDLTCISASPLRPLAQQLQNVSVNLLCQWSDSSSSSLGQAAAARLLGHVYITAGKVQAGQSWKKTVESLVGSSHALLTPLVSTLIEEYGSSADLAPLDTPPLPGQASRSTDQTEMLYPALQRLETIFGVLLSMLGASTERAVPVPIGVLVRLCQRLFSLTIHSPTKERHDANLHLVQLSLLPRLHVLGCKLLGQLAKSLGTYLTAYTTHLLAQIAFAQGTYPSGSAVRCSFYAVTSILVQSCPIHPDEGSKSLSKIVSSILENAAFLVDPDEGRKSSSIGRESAAEGNKNGERKAKRQKIYEAAEMAGRRRVDELEVTIVKNGLSSLRRILASGAWLLPPGQLNMVLRLLLAFTLSPSFFTSCPSPASYCLLSEALSLCPTLRSTILSCLVAAVHTTARESSGLLDHAIAVLRRGVGSNVSEREKEMCREGLAAVDVTTRPVVPPLLKTKAMRLAMEELMGGSVDQADKAQEEEDAEEEPMEMDGSRVPTAGTNPVEQGNAAARPAGYSAFQPTHVDASPAATAADPMPEPAPETVSTSKGLSAFNRPTAAAIEELQPPEAPSNAVRPAPPPTEEITTDSSTAIPVPLASEEIPDPENQSANASDPQAEETVAAPVLQGGPAGEDSDSDDDDAPLPKIVLSDSEEDV